MNIYNKLTCMLTIFLHTLLLSSSFQGTQLLHRCPKSRLFSRKHLLNQMGQDSNLTQRTFSTHLSNRFKKIYPTYRFGTFMIKSCRFSQTISKELVRPFLEATKKWDLNTLKKLHQEGANVDITDQDGNTALHWAIETEAPFDILFWLVFVAKVDMSARRKYDNLSPFLLAAKKGNLAALYILFKESGHINAFSKYALHYAAAYAPEGKGIEWLIDIAGLDIEERERSFRTPFLLAAGKGNIPALKILKAKGANLYAKGDEDYTALHFAAKHAPQGQGIEWIINTTNININAQARRCIIPFFAAIETSNLPALKLLKEKGADVHAKESYSNRSALHYAIDFKSNPEVIEWLIDTAEVDIEAKADGEETPFLYAAKQGNLAALQILYKKRANPYAISKDGNNALHLAAAFAPKAQGVEWLIDTIQMAINAEGESKKTPFLFAASTGNLLALKILKEKGAHLYATSQYNHKALYFAENQSKDLATIQWLKNECNLTRR